METEYGESVSSRLHGSTVVLITDTSSSLCSFLLGLHLKQRVETLNLNSMDKFSLHKHRTCFRTVQRDGKNISLLWIPLIKLALLARTPVGE